MPETTEKYNDILPNYSEEVQDILGYIPNWIIRWGITVILVILASFLICSWLFKYPDLITAAVIVSGENPPAAVVARVDGRIQKLLVSDGNDVSVYTPLAVLENPAIAEQALNLQDRLNKLPVDWTASSAVLARLDFPRQLVLGTTQPAYEDFRRSCEEYRLFRNLHYHSNKIASLERQRNTIRGMVANFTRQVSIQEEDFLLLQKQSQRNEELFKSGIVSVQDREGAQIELLQKEFALNGGRTALADARLRLEQLEAELLDLSLQEREKNQQLLTQLQQTLRNLSGQLAQWDQIYVLRAPVAGKVSFTKFWSSNQQVKAGDMVLAVAPPGAVRLIGKVLLPLDGAGKVKAGQRVNLRFADFPYIEFGTVPGLVRSKSLVASEGYYSVDINLPQGLKTNYSKILPFTQQLQGQAEIITDDIRLLTRLFNPLRSLFKQHTEF